MNKSKMAHDWFMKNATGNPTFMITEVELSWNYADAMQAEADKREDKSIPDVFKKDKDGNCLHTHTTFGGGECFDCGVNLKEEWQPDWSQAPDHADWWAMDLNGCTYWYFGGEPLISSKMWIREHTYTQEKAGSYGYTGSWKDSLRKRQKGGFKRYYGDGLECAR